MSLYRCENCGHVPEQLPGPKGLDLRDEVERETIRAACALAADNDRLRAAGEALAKCAGCHSHVPGDPCPALDAWRALVAP